VKLRGDVGFLFDIFGVGCNGEDACFGPTHAAMFASLRLLNSWIVFGSHSRSSHREEREWLRKIEPPVPIAA